MAALEDHPVYKRIIERENEKLAKKLVSGVIVTILAIQNVKKN